MVMAFLHCDTGVFSGVHMFAFGYNTWLKELSLSTVPNTQQSCF